MPREGTKTKSAPTTQAKIIIEIRYAPGGDENRETFNIQVILNN